MKRLAWVVALLCGSILADDGEGITRADLKAWNAGPGKELGKRILEKQIKELDQMLSAAKRAPINRNAPEPKIGKLNNRMVMVFPNTKSKTEVVNKLKEAIVLGKEAAKNPPPAYPDLHYNRLAVGRIGILKIPATDQEMTFQVVQIIDGNNMIVNIPTTRWRDHETVWFVRSTDGLADDSIYKLEDRVFEVIGTKTYETTIGGSKTVLQLVERSPEELAK